MPQLVRPGSGRGSARHSLRGRRLSLAWMFLLVLPPLSVLSAAASARETREASVYSDEVVRDGCVVHVADADAHGIAEVSTDCRWPIASERVAEIVRDHDAIDDVLSSLSESRVLPDGRVVQVHSMGGLAAERQVTMRFRSRELEDGGLRIDFEPAREQHRLYEGHVQIAVDEGWWEIRSDGAGGTRLRYSVRYDAGGNLKPWIVRRFQKAGVVRSMAEIRLAAERPLPVSASPEGPAASTSTGAASSEPAPSQPGAPRGAPSGARPEPKSP